MKILQVITELRPGGAERVVADLALGLKARGHEVAVVALRPLPAASVILDDLRAGGIPIRSLNVTRLTPWRFFRLKTRVREFQPAIVHAHLFHANLASRLNLLKYDCTLVNTVHICERRKSKIWHFWLDRLTFRLCTVQTAVSQAVQKYHARHTGRKVESLPLIYNGIKMPPTLVSADKERLREAWGVAACTRVIGAAGRLDWQKGFDRIMRLLPALSTKIPIGQQWAVVILGDGPERRHLLNLASKCPANLMIKLPGYRADAATCFGAFDLFVMPSRYEGFGLTLTEAMGHGIPVLSSDVDSLPELLQGYRNGRYLDFERASSFAIVGIMLEMMQRQRQEPRILFTLERMLDSYMDLYRQYRPDAVQS